MEGYKGPNNERNESADNLENRIEVAQSINELLTALESTDFILSETVGEIPTAMIIDGIKSLAYKAPEMPERSDGDEMERYLAERGVTRTYGIRAKAMELLLKPQE